MMIRIYGLSVRNRPAAIALAAVALGLGAVFVAFGIILLLGLAAIGTAAGAGVVLYRSLTGRRAPPLPRSHDPELDPALEVFPERRSAQPLPPPPARPRAHESD